MGEPHRQRAKLRVSKETKLRLRVVFLDDTERTFEVESKVLGGDFYNRVCDHLKLLEKEYFGLEFRHHSGSYVWLEMLKPLAKQIKYNNDLFFRFIVKFFPPDPGQLKRALTRYMFALQIKQDLSNGSLTCNDNSAALLVSHILQSELGNYEEELVCHHLQMKQYVPNQEYLDHKILRFHKKHRGASPADSDRHLLEVVRRLEMYGIRPHAAHDGEGMRLTLAVTHSGVLVFQGNTKINTFSWAKIRKLSFKRKNFIIKLHETVGPSHKDAVLFSMASRDVCKSFWKMCVEYHAFFRLERELQPDHKTLLTCRGSSFRYSGRTQKQLMESSGSSEIKHTHFERVYSQSDYDPRQCHSSPDLLTDESKQLKGSGGGALAHPTRGDLRGGAKRSQSSGEVYRSPRPLLWRAPPPSSPGTRQPSPAPNPRSASVSGDDDEDAGGGRSQARRLAGVYGNLSRYGNRPRLFSGDAHPQQLVLLFPPGGTAPSLPIFPLPGNAPSSSMDYLHHRQHRPRRSAGATDGSLPPPPRRPPAAVPGHYSDDSTFLPGLPRRSASQPDVQRNPPRRAPSSTFDPASEFRPLGYYPHLTRPLPRPTHLPLLPPLPDTPPWGRPASLCVIGGRGEAGRGGYYSDPEVLYPYYYYCCGHLVAGPGAAGLTRMTFSSGSLQLEEEEDEDEEQQEVGRRGEVRVTKITL